jgi:membrane-associated phospholipid phosphatase
MVRNRGKLANVIAGIFKSANLASSGGTGQLLSENRLHKNAGNNLIAIWWQGIANWFAFVHYRRPDVSHPVFPNPVQSAQWLAFFAAVLAVLVTFGDPLLLEFIRHPDWNAPYIFLIITELGTSDWILYITGVMLIGFTIRRPGDMKLRSMYRAHTIMLGAYFIFTSIAFSGLLTNLFKMLFGRARPKFVLEGEFWTSNPFGDNYEFASFPSGHATTAGALTIALVLLFPRFRILFLVIGVLIAISRPAIGVHFPSDVFAGFCFGAAFTYIYARSFARKRLLFAFSHSGHPVLRFPRVAIQHRSHTQ